MLPDVDLETARELASRFLAALSADQHHALAAERAAAEAHLATLAEVALGQDGLADEAGALLEQIRKEAAAAQQRLTSPASG